MTVRIAIVLLLLSACARPEPAADGNAADPAPPPAEEAPHPVCHAEWRDMAPGLRHRDRCEDGVATLHLAEIDPRLWTLDALIVEPATAPDAAAAAGAPFAINANFFDEQRRTIGAIVTGGRIVQEPHRGSWQSIFHVDAAGKAAIDLPEAWPRVRGGAQMAVQAGPRLVVAGRPTDALRATPSLRSGVCIREDGRVVFFVTAALRPYDVHEMIAIAAAEEAGGGLECRDAMLFDGGPSAQMHLEAAEISIARDAVPAFVAARPRFTAEIRR